MTARHIIVKQFKSLDFGVYFCSAIPEASIYWPADPDNEYCKDSYFIE